MTTKKKTSERLPNEIAIVGELFDEQETEIFKQILEVKPGKPITFYINCAGGNVYSALAIVALTRLRKHPCTAYVLGECSSAAILIFASCKARWVTPRSVFLFHRVKWGADREVRSEEAENWASHFKWLEQELDRFQSDMIGQSEDDLKEWTRTSQFILGTQLVEKGIAQLIED